MISSWVCTVCFYTDTANRINAYISGLVEKFSGKCH